MVIPSKRYSHDPSLNADRSPWFNGKNPKLTPWADASRNFTDSILLIHVCTFIVLKLRVRMSVGFLFPAFFCSFCYVFFFHLITFWLNIPYLSLIDVRSVDLRIRSFVRWCSSTYNDVHSPGPDGENIHFTRGREKKRFAGFVKIYATNHTMFARGCYDTGQRHLTEIH